MTVHLCTFSDESMSRSRQLCHASAKAHGVDDAGQDNAWTPRRLVDWCDDSATWHSVDREQAATGVSTQIKNAIKHGTRGLGYWTWKPFIIMEALEFGYRQGDILIYADAGVEFINNVNYIIDRMDQDIFLFGNNWEHAHWCKRDVIDAVWPAPRDPAGTDFLVPSWWRFGKQVQASVIFFRVSDYTRKFVKEWLDWCLFEGGRLIDDSPSRTPNHPEFREHRHDQAILTTLAYREGIKLHYWPASYNDGAFTYEKLPEYAGDNYPSPLFNHHRRRNLDWPIQEDALAIPASLYQE